ncbi:MAG: DNA repair protein RadC [Lachnospiraceae bacterium]|nr:DNA repair protein RadC [Lachnospiraceae bacterium]
MKNHFTVKELPFEQQPDERCLKDGGRSLTNAELLAVIIRTGTSNARATDLAEHLLKKVEQDGLAGLYMLTAKDIMSVRGMGKVKAAQMLAVIELSKRISKAVFKKNGPYNSPELLAKYYMQDMRCLMREQVVLVMMDAKSCIIKDEIISVGTVDASILSPREVFIKALEYQAVFIVLLHNHPSGDPTPSGEDIRITQRIERVGQMIGIKLMDHIIIGDNRYVSMKEKGML